MASLEIVINQNSDRKALAVLVSAERPANWAELICQTVLLFITIRKVDFPRKVHFLGELTSQKIRLPKKIEFPVNLTSPKSYFLSTLVKMSKETFETL